MRPRPAVDGGVYLIAFAEGVCEMVMMKMV